MNQQQIELPIGGMTCIGCGQHVTNALEAVPGVQKVTVPGWQSARAMVIADESVGSEALISAVRAAGYTASIQTRRMFNQQAVETVSNTNFDFLVIGGGAVGFDAAIAASELG